MEFPATDSDGGSDGDVRYEIISGNEAGHFQIDSSTGTITVIQELDYDYGINNFLLTFKASDNAFTDPKHSLMNVSILVLDVDDECPVMNRTAQSIYVFHENETLHLPFTISDVDTVGELTVDMKIQSSVENLPMLHVNSLPLSVIN